MQKIGLDRNKKAVFLMLIAACVLTITVTRAAITEITYDEAYTYMAYAEEIRFNDFDTFRYIYNESVANNHWLNTIAIAAVERILGVTYCEFAIRLPNLIAFAAYCVYVCVSYRKRMISFICAAFLLLNYYLNEFYGLARGYAMAQTCVYAAAFYYLCWKESAYQKHRCLVGCALGLMVGTWANTVVFLLLPAFGILWIWRLISAKQFWPFLKKLAWFVVLFILSSLFLLKYHFKISASDMPLYTGEGGFYDSVVRSYLGMLTSAPKLIPLLLAALCVISATAVFILKKGVFQCDLTLGLGIFIVTNILMNAVLHKGYITERVAIPFYGYIVLSLFQLWNTAWDRLDEKWLEGEKKRQVHMAVTVLIVCALCFHNLHMLSFTSTTDWAHNYGRRDRILAGYIRTGEYQELEDHEENRMNDRFYRVKYWYILNSDL